MGQKFLPDPTGLLAGQRQRSYETSGLLEFVGFVEFIGFVLEYPLPSGTVDSLCDHQPQDYGLRFLPRSDWPPPKGRSHILASPAYPYVSMPRDSATPIALGSIMGEMIITRAALMSCLFS